MARVSITKPLILTPENGTSISPSKAQKSKGNGRTIKLGVGMNRDREVGILFEAQITIERKSYYFSLCENHLGRYVRITESSGPYGRRNAIVIPSGGLVDIQRILLTMIQTEAQTPVCTDQEEQASIPQSVEDQGNVFRVPLRQGRSGQYSMGNT